MDNTEAVEKLAHILLPYTEAGTQFIATREILAAIQAERDEDANQLDSARHTVDVVTPPPR